MLFFYKTNTLTRRIGLRTGKSQSRLSIISRSTQNNLYISFQFKKQNNPKQIFSCSKSWSLLDFLTKFRSKHFGCFVLAKYFFFCFFQKKNACFSLNFIIQQLNYQRLDFIIYCGLLFLRLCQSHDLCHEFDKLTELAFLSIFLINFFSSFSIQYF